MSKISNAAAAAVLTLAVGLGSAAVAGSATAATPHAISRPCYAKAIFDSRGPGAKNYRAFDATCNDAGSPGEWWGPWRLKKSSAQADAKAHNARWS